MFFIKKNVKKWKKKHKEQKEHKKTNIKELKKKKEKNLYDILVSIYLKIKKKKKKFMTGVIQINHYLVDKHLMLPIKYFMR